MKSVRNEIILILVTEVAAELFPSRNSESNRCVTLQVSHSVLSSFIAFFPCHNPVFYPVLPNLGPRLWLHSSQAFWVPGGCVKLLVFSEYRQRSQHSTVAFKQSNRVNPFFWTPTILEYFWTVDTLIVSVNYTSPIVRTESPSWEPMLYSILN